MKSAIGTDKTLFYENMGHEGTHGSHIYSFGKQMQTHMGRVYSEIVAYEFSVKMLKGTKFTTEYKGVVKMLNNYKAILKQYGYPPVPEKWYKTNNLFIRKK